MSDEQQPEVAQAIGPGQLLKNARLAHRLSLEQIGSRIHLKASLLAELEADHYDQGISMTFIKGYLKLYARQVEVSEAEILDALETMNTHKKEPAKLQSFSRRVAHQANDEKLMLVTYLILAAVVALVVVWWFQQDGKEALVSGPQVSLENEVQSHLKPGLLSVDNQAEDISQAANITDFSRDSSQVVSAQTADPQPLEVTEQATLVDASEALVQTVTPQAAGQLPQPLKEASADPIELLEKVELVFEFMADCWMSLTDATGEDIAFGVKGAGRVMTVSGVPPFKLILGAPSEVKINYAGQDLDMSRFKTGRTAEFTLPLVQ